jgi:hypothetical protein
MPPADFFVQFVFKPKAAPELIRGGNRLASGKTRQIEHRMGSRSGSIQSDHDPASIRSICNFIRTKAFIIALNLHSP